MNDQNNQAESSSELMRIAKEIVEAGDVRRDTDGYYVVRDIYKGSPRPSIVSRKPVGANRRIVCDCADFKEKNAIDATFECEHILAVRIFVEESAGSKK